MYPIPFAQCTPTTPSSTAPVLFPEFYWKTEDTQLPTHTSSARQMNSRLRTENATIFDVCCMVNYGTRTSELSSEIKVLYPLEFSDDSVLRSIKQFCFPYQDSKSGENEAVQLFTFVFTDSQSLHTFGYCRFTPRTNSCLCILSGYFWVNLFYNLLNHISTVFTNASLSDVESLLTNAYHMDIPTPGSKLKLNACTAIAIF